MPAKDRLHEYIVNDDKQMWTVHVELDSEDVTLVSTKSVHFPVDSPPVHRIRNAILNEMKEWPHLCFFIKPSEIDPTTASYAPFEPAV